ncbi:MAG: TraI/MobA(P) family conjugative relaxase [Pseudomonadota bacterium]
MISKRIAGRKDGKSSATTALRYGEGLTPDRETGLILDKSHRTRLGNFGLVDDGVYEGRNITEMTDLINMAAFEMQSNCDLNTRVGADKKLAHFVVSYNQIKPSEAVLRDTEDSMLSVMALDENHFATFLHNDNGYRHLHIFASRIERGSLHRGNALWHDQINRDKVCREVEIRHNLQRDNGLHKVDELGQIVEIPREERRAKRDSNILSVSDRARTTEIYSGEKSFQTWANEIRIGDRLKHAKSWQDLHAAAAAYGCEIKPKGAGYVIIPVGKKGGIQLSKIGLKNLPAKFGAFQNAVPGQQTQPETVYKLSPTQANAASHYDQWSVAKDTFKPIKTALINEQRELHRQIRKNLQVQHKANLEKIRAATKGQERFVAVSVAKMEHAIALANLADQLAHNRQALHKQLADQGPGNTFRDYLVKEAIKGDEHALILAQKYGAQEATKVARQREADHLQIVAAATGSETSLAQRTRLNFTHRVERNGTVIYDLGRGRMITDSAISRQVQLNNMAASSPEAISTALQFASARFGRTLTLYGTQEFQRLAVEIAVKKGLAVNFADPTLDAYREKLLLDKQQIAFNHRKQQSLTNDQKVKEVNHIPHEVISPEEHLAKVIEHVTDPLQDWKDENPDMNQTNLLEGPGKVLHVLSDGRWIQNKGRGNFAVQPSSLGIQLEIGNNVSVGKNGNVELLSAKSKLVR